MKVFKMTMLVVRVLALALVMAVGSAVHAGTTTIDTVMDFEEIANTGGSFEFFNLAYQFNGYRLTSSGGASGSTHGFASAHTDNSLFYQGSTMLFSNDQNSVITLKRVDGGTFDLFSIDLATLRLTGAGHTIEFTSNNGGFQSFVLTGGGPLIETFVFSSAFDDVTSVSWPQGSASSDTFHQFDNITVVSTVPTPGSLALFGLVGLASRCRRRRAS